MPFSAKINKEDIFPVIHLKDESAKTQATIYSFGALLNGFVINEDLNVIDGFDSCSDAKENITKSFRSSKLSPFVCRITDGKYSFNQREYKTGKFFLEKESIHGLLYDANFTIGSCGVDDLCAFATLQYEYTKKDEGFPFDYSCTVTYRLEKQNKLSIITSVRNDSQQEMPLADGWHPYFRMGGVIDDLFLKLNADEVLEFNDKLVPTGNILPFNKFQTTQLFGKTFLDNCFLLKNHEQPACVLEDPVNKLRLSIWADPSYPYLQIYTPDHRHSIAIENLSSAPDAFNNGMGLVILKPQQSHEFKTTYCVEGF